MEGNSSDLVGGRNGTDTNVTYVAAYGRRGRGVKMVTSAASNVVIAVPLNLNNNFTICFWLNTPSEKSGWNWFMNFNDYGTSGSHAMSIATQSWWIRWSFGAWFTEGADSNVIQLSANKRYHYAVVRNNGYLYTYINGKQVGNANATSASSFPTTGNLNLGRGPSAISTDRYSGGLDEVIFANDAWTQAKIRRIYAMGLGCF